MNCLVCGSPVPQPRTGRPATMCPGECRASHYREICKRRDQRKREAERGKGWTDEGAHIIRRIMAKVREINRAEQERAEREWWERHNQRRMA